MLSFTADRTGFPMVTVDALKLDVQLFPVTKLQFEIFMAEPNQFDDCWYETILEMNPRSKRCSGEHLERLFLTGIFPSEAVLFARWIGDEYQLPTAVQWKAIYERFQTVRRPSAGWSHVSHDVDAPASRCLDALLRQTDAFSLTKLARMDDGVMEWIRGRCGWQLIGQPRTRFGHQLFSCRTPVTPTNVVKRSALCGFRLVRQRTACRGK